MDSSSDEEKDDEEEGDKNMEDVWGKQDDKPLPHRHHEGSFNTTVIDIDDI